MKAKDIPNFGLLPGLKVVGSVVSTAGGFTMKLFAESGANAIWIESPFGQDPMRFSGGGWGIENERRNIRNISLNVPTPEGKEIFKNLLKDADIFVEASRGGQWSDWGLNDEVLWEVNPKLVIVHMSGYGQSGDPNYIKRPGFDHTIQAYCGLLEINGYPEQDPCLAVKFPTDYYSGLYAYGCSLAGYINAQKTNRGESIDLAQYEVGLSCQAGLPGNWLNAGKQEPRDGSKRHDTAGVGYYVCKDGAGVYTILIGLNVMKRLFPLIGLEYGQPPFPDGVTRVLRKDKAAAELYERKVTEYFLSKTALEAETELSAQGIPCARSMNYAMMETDPHYIARKSIIEWETVKGEKIRGIAPIPRYKNNPTVIFRGCPSVGMDNDDILAEVGYNQEQIKEFYEKKIIKQSDIVRISGT
ncbi:MAG: CoA transferase [Gracilibacteraceae bacterium]|jgi:L-carnitine CoA-transferase|nr:CoA transferase [Gracilibacteraceae bacterium]